jgi:putative ATP-binding cassette transporter
MNVIRWMIRLAPKLTALSIGTGILSGFATAALISYLNKSLLNTKELTKNQLLIYIGFAVSSIVLTGLSQIAIGRLSHKSLEGVRVGLCRKILDTPLRQLEVMGNGRLLAALTENVLTISGGINMIPNLCVSIMTVLGCFGFLFCLSYKIAFCILSLVLVGIVGHQLIARVAMKPFRKSQQEQDLLFEQLRLMLDGIKEIKLHDGRKDAFFSNSILQKSLSLTSLRNRSVIIFILGGMWISVATYLLLGLLVFGGPVFFESAKHLLTSSIIIVLFMLGPLTFIVQAIPALIRAGIVMNELEKLGVFLTPETSVWTPHALLPGSNVSWSRVDLKGICHSYRRESDDSEFQLGPIDLSFMPGELVFLVGGNGSGKTTLAKILVGLYQPETGRIFLDQKPITAENQHAYRQMFSAVFTDSCVFNNLFGVQEEKVSEQAGPLLLQLQLDKKVQIDHGNFSTTKLSHGQVRRLGLLTALLEDRPFYLFDEWAATQDSSFKDIFYLKILPSLKDRGKSIVVITHDEKYFHLADRTIKLDCGKIVELGAARDRQISILS